MQLIVPNIQPFRGLRYDLGNVGALSDVVAPPYDVIDSKMQDRLYQRHPENVIRLILNRDQPDDGPQSKYLRAAAELRNWQREGVMTLENQPALYVYHQTFTHEGQTYTRRGFMARVLLEPFGTGNIFPHEETHSKAKQDRLNLITACKANLSQVFGLYPDPDNVVQESLEVLVPSITPLEAVDELGVTHRMWPITNTDVNSKVSQLIGDLPVYIADGHHRYETACNYRDARIAEGTHTAVCDYVLMMLVSMDDPGMVVLPTHRMFRGIPPMDHQELKSKLADRFVVTKIGTGAVVAEQLWEEIELEGSQEVLGLYTAKDDCWNRVELSPEGMDRLAEIAADHCDDWRGLGVSILHHLLVQDCLGLSDLPTPKYVHRVEEVIQGIQTGDDVGRDATGQVGEGQPFQLCAMVMPASLDHIRNVSQAFERMPAKSTYFYPKLLSGLVINPLG